MVTEETAKDRRSYDPHVYVSVLYEIRTDKHKTRPDVPCNDQVTYASFQQWRLDTRRYHRVSVQKLIRLMPS